MTEADHQVLYEFEGFRLDPSRFLLLTRADGHPVPLTPRTFDSLVYLVEHQGELLSKDRLMAAIWPDTIVSENNLNQKISTLRQALGERPGDHRFIVTVPGRGYRFVAPVRRVPAADPIENERRLEGAREAFAPRRYWRAAAVGMVGLLAVGIAAAALGGNGLMNRWFNTAVAGPSLTSPAPPASLELPFVISQPMPD